MAQAVKAQRFAPIEIVVNEFGGSRIIASDQLIAELRAHIDREGSDVSALGQWIAERIEEYGAQTAQTVFDMEGNGPMCSWCGGIWGLCPHIRTTLMYSD